VVVNDLDRKIAELKGFTNLQLWRPFDREPEDARDFVIWGHPAGEPGIDLNIVGGPWSTSDSKALELVDELCVDQPDGMGARFHLIRWEAKGTKAARWEARIEP
jgi:hypothetical protein